MLRQGSVRALQQRLQPGQPARRHGGRAVAALGAGQDHLGRRHRGGQKVMRGDADRRLGRGQADGGAHRAGQPRAGLGRRRPDGLDQAAEHHDVDGLQPRLQRSPDEDARMLDAAAAAQRAAAAHHLALQQRVEQPGHHVAALVRQVGQRGQRRGQQRGEGLAFLLGPQPDGAVRFRRWRRGFRRRRSGRPARRPGRSSTLA